ncbi:MAG TPA: hypothetical protein DEB06_09000 [Phycisphaerales bacterium]|nr:hypothetical protein [Phycisphaerales bacterium]
MRIPLLIVMSALIVGGFLLYMSSYTVRFNEAAIVTTFGQVSDRGVVTEPGLRFKWPAPVQSVTTYDTRARFLTTRGETQQTADDRQIIVEAFLVWRVSNPLEFYKRNRDQAGGAAAQQFRKAEDQLTSVLRSALSEVSRYRLTDLFGAEAGGSKLPELEQSILDRLRLPSDQGGWDVGSFGVEVLLVGISSIELPEETTRQVFERMTEGRKRLAAKTESEGQAEATAIRSQADAAAERIRAFARLRADQIRNEGQREAAQYLAALKEDEELASFLLTLDLMRDSLGRKSTVVLPTSLPGLLMFRPETLMRVRAGMLPPSESRPGTVAPAGGTGAQP